MRRTVLFILLAITVIPLASALAAPLHHHTARFIIPTNHRVVLYVADG